MVFSPKRSLCLYKTWLLNFKQLLTLNTTANWLDYMQIKATEMEGWRLETQHWIQNFHSQVAELELERNTILESSGNDRSSHPGNLVGANTPFVSKKSSQVSS